MDDLEKQQLEDLSEEDFIPFREKYASQIKAGLSILFVLIFYFSYRTFSPIQSLVDMVVTPAVAGITIIYGKASSFVHKITGINLGFVKKEPDSDFLFRVQLANYINNKKAAALVEISTDQLASRKQREDSLLALLKFESTADWVQPFLNELFKGGMLQLYEPEAPLLDALMKKVRSEGGIRNSLVRAYAEVVLAFMIQVPDQPIVRQRSLGWLSDVLAEDALFLIVPRLPREKDPATQRAIEKALWDIRAISNPSRALNQLLPYYRDPPWPEVRIPVSMILARLGYGGAKAFLQKALSKDEILTEEEKIMARVALAGKPYPKELRITPMAETMLAKRARARRIQYAEASKKQQAIKRQEKTRQYLLARIEKKGKSRSVPKEAAQTAPKSTDKRLASAQKEAPPQGVPSQGVPPKGPSAVAKEESLTTEAVASKKATAPGAFHKPLLKDDTPEKKLASVPQSVDDSSYAAEALKTQTAPPPVDLPKDSGLTVDIIFEARDQALPLYSGPGFDQSVTGAVLPKGTKGKAKLMKVIGNDEWYQVVSKKGSGWAPGSLLKIYDLSPGLTGQPAAGKEAGLPPEAGREEYTYFEPNIENAPAYAGPTDKSHTIANLKMGVAYLAVQSKKEGPNRWFKLKIDDDKEGWVSGTDIQLSERKKPKQTGYGSYAKAMPGRMKHTTSAFAPEWVVAGVIGVGVYNRASIAGELLQTISPPHIYRVLDMKEGSGKEWYKIQIAKRKTGWVQALDVNLTSPK